MNISQIKVGNTTYDIRDQVARDELSNGELVHYITNPTGTAGNGTTGSLNRARWAGTISGVTSLYAGLIIAYKIPTAGHARGTTLELSYTDSGGNTVSLGEHPLVLNAASTLTSHYPVGSIVQLVYDPVQTLAVYVNNVSTTFTGCWKISNYDSVNIYQIRHNGAAYLAYDKLCPYGLLLQSTDGQYLIPINSVGGTGTGKQLTTARFNPFGDIYYWNSNSNIASGANITATAIYQQICFDLRYSFNTGYTLTANRDVYIVADPQSDGAAVLSSTPIAQQLPDTEDGKIYIRLGHSYNTYSIELYPVHPVYYYKNGRVQLWTGFDSSQSIASKADKVSGATANNFAALDANGNLIDSGHKHGDYLTAHQDISGKADKSATVSTVAYDTTNKKITKTINGTTSDVVTSSTIVTDGGGIKSHASRKLVVTNGTASAASQGTEITYVESVAGANSGSTGDLTATTTRKKITVPTAVSETTVSGWGFTKNAGTVTGVKMNGTTNNPTSGVVDLGTVITAHQNISGKADKATTLSGYGITDAKINNGEITLGSNSITPVAQTTFNKSSGNSGVIGYYKISINSYVNWNISFTVNAYIGYRYYELAIGGINSSSGVWNRNFATLKGSSETSVEVVFGHDSANHLFVAIPAYRYTEIGISEVRNAFTNSNHSIASIPIDDLFTIEFKATNANGVAATLGSTAVVDSTVVVNSPLTLCSVDDSSNVTFPAAVNATAFNQTSDERQKDIVDDVSLTIEEIAGAPAKKFVWKDGIDASQHAGTIAQYWQKVLPEVVSEDNGGMLSVDYGVAALMSVIALSKRVIELESILKEKGIS